MVTHPRWIGAGLGALVGIIFIVAGQVLSVVFYDQGGLSTDLGSFSALGVPMAILGLPIGALVAPWALRERRWMVGAGTLFSLLVVVGTLAGFALYGIWRGFDLSGSAGSFVAALPWFAAIGMAAAISWVALLRKVGAGPRQSVPTAIVAVALISVTILVESRLPT